ncbi:MAG TPA: beta-eliminating lyase-related protein [Bryobacteraceae bacterium]|nr:beta-eliminating lyase-related protein [Bryobacteraceae bacterium]
MRRRSFLGAPLAASFAPQKQAAAASDVRIYAMGDGIPYSPFEYAQLLTKVSDVEADDFSRGGVVEKLEARMASLLGKEAAVWFPTGTMANHIAVRVLAGANRRVLVPAESHLYNDCGDCCQTLSGLNLVPLGQAKSTFTLEEVEKANSSAMLGRVAAPIGAIEIETPVRRRLGERFDFDEMKKISVWARGRKIGLHLDGARLLIETAYTGRPVNEYTSLFDTVYVSLYKYLNAASGAILAGPKALLENMYHVRRMFGGGLPQVWPFAAVALHTLKDFEATFRKARETSESVLKTLSTDSSFAIERIPNGTNIFRLRVHSVNAPVYHLRLEEAGISAAAPQQDWFALRVNATWARVAPEEIVARFRKALG